jgi:hypothetical protein
MRPTSRRASLSSTAFLPRSGHAAGEHNLGTIDFKVHIITTRSQPPSVLSLLGSFSVSALDLDLLPMQ